MKHESTTAESPDSEASGANHPAEVAWFAALCDDDYEYLGVPDPKLASSFPHCREITLAADRCGYDNILLPSGYTLGIDSVSFAGGVAPDIKQMQLLLAVRMGEMWPPQSARQLATLDQMLNGRLTINIISSDIPGEQLASAPRYQRARECMRVLRALLNGEGVEMDGEFLKLSVEPPRASTVSGKCPPFYFGGFSDDAKDTAASDADVFLTWPDTVKSVGQTIAEMKQRAAQYNRALKFGLRTHMIVRETESEALDAAKSLLSRLNPQEGERIRKRSLDATSYGVQRQAELRDQADADDFVEPGLWTGIGRARSGAGAALVGDPDQIKAKLVAYQAAGVDAFILSGYPHRKECERFAALVLEDFSHAPLPR